MIYDMIINYDPMGKFAEVFHDFSQDLYRNNQV